MGTYMSIPNHLDSFDTLDIPNQLDPFDTLNIKNNPSRQEVKCAFRHHIRSPNRQQRALIALAYDMICSRDQQKYTRSGDEFYVRRKDLFYYATTGNYGRFSKQIERQKSLLDHTDEYGRTLLYISARNGFHDICHFLLKSGCKTNQIQNDGSTALHAAAFYGHQLIVELLLEYGANSEIRNNFGHTAQEESCTPKIRKCIETKSVDQIHTLLNLLRNQGCAKNMVVIERFGKVIAKKMLRNPECFSGHSLSYLTQNWVLAWHGTKYKHLQSIMQHGLHAAGTVLSTDNHVSTQAGHIGLDKRIGSFDNWAKAIFISPSIFYAADMVYSERIFSDGQRWCVLVEVRAKPGKFTKHKQTLLNQHVLLPGEPDDLEYRVAVKSDEDFILRVESNRNVIVTALVFVNLTFLENIDEYYQGEKLVASSEDERALFQ